jgi:hypothetical protein
MAIAITCPAEAQMYLRTVLTTYPPHGLAALVAAFMRDNNLPERKIRDIAAARKVTITMVVRALMVQKYPALKPLWPPHKPTPAQVEGIIRRTKLPSDTKSVAQLAASLMQRLLEDPDDGHAKRHAREFVSRYLD